ncbi:MAG: tRNA (adenosine(37)-N6)-dimethylallyltransferase MiaA [Clostridiales bacterium]|nr:tRNA (adenosine(37)-N6)-dimethylallyltransferase MiaA [Clostridiales bacterium]
MNDRRILVIAGPTAVGKTEYAIEAAKAFNGEIVSCDSMQLYQYMDIGSAKPTAAERAEAVHHLIDFLNPREEFSVARYQKLAREAIDDILSRGKLPVISGGTGLYLNSILYDMDFADASGDEKLRETLRKVAEEEGSEALHSQLAEMDPEAAARIHPNNTKKIIRAIERLQAGEGRVRPFDSSISENKDYDPLLVCLTRNREELYDRINRRVDALIEAGLVEEVRSLMDMGLTADDISMKGIGYKEIIAYLEGETTLDEAIDLIKKNTRHYAKRQLTWFRRYDKINVVNLSEYLSEEEAKRGLIGWLEKKL